MNALYIFIAALLVVALIIYLKNQKSKKTEEPVPSFPDKPVVTPGEVETFAWWGEAMPSHNSSESALASPSHTRLFYTTFPALARNVVLYHTADRNETVDGRGKWIALTDSAKENVYACKIEDKGNIKAFIKA